MFINIPIEHRHLLLHRLNRMHDPLELIHIKNARKQKIGRESIGADRILVFISFKKAKLVNIK